MPLHHDLLEQAAHLATRERNRPRQASLRRAVSAAYYAVFHMIVADGARLLAPPDPPALRLAIQRAFNHSDIRDACRKLLAAQQAATRRSLVPRTTTVNTLTLPLDAALTRFIDAVLELQDLRLRADYDAGTRWNRSEALSHIDLARDAFEAWADVRKSPNAAVALAAMLLQKQWNR